MPTGLKSNTKPAVTGSITMSNFVIVAVIVFTVSPQVIVISCAPISSLLNGYVSVFFSNVLVDTILPSTAITTSGVSVLGSYTV